MQLKDGITQNLNSKKLFRRSLLTAAPLAVPLAALRLGAQTPAPPQPPLPSPTVLAFFYSNIFNLSQKLTARRTTPEDFDRASAATQLWFDYLAELGYNPLLAQFISLDVLPAAITQAQFTVVRGRMGLVNPPALISDAQFNAFLRLADNHFPAAQHAFALSGPAGLSNAIITSLQGSKRPDPAQVGIAAQYIGMNAVCIFQLRHDVSIPWAESNWEFAIDYLAIILAYLAEAAS